MPGSWDGKSRPSNNKYRKNFDDIFKKTRVRVAGGKAVGRSSVRVKESKRNKAIRRIALPLTEKHWRNTGQSVYKLHRIYRIAEYLLERQKRNK